MSLFLFLYCVHLTNKRNHGVVKRSQLCIAKIFKNIHHFETTTFVDSSIVLRQVCLKKTRQTQGLPTSACRKENVKKMGMPLEVEVLTPFCYSVNGTYTVHVWWPSTWALWSSFHRLVLPLFWHYMFYKKIYLNNMGFC